MCMHLNKWTIGYVKDICTGLYNYINRHTSNHNQRSITRPVHTMITVAKVGNKLILYYCTMTTLAIYGINFSFACLVTSGFSARLVHNCIYLFFKYTDPLAMYMCIVLLMTMGPITMFIFEQYFFEFWRDVNFAILADNMDTAKFSHPQNIAMSLKKSI